MDCRLWIKIAVLFYRAMRFRIRAAQVNLFHQAYITFLDQAGHKVVLDLLARFLTNYCLPGHYTLSQYFVVTSSLFVYL